MSVLIFHICLSFLLVPDFSGTLQKLPLFKELSEMQLTKVQVCNVSTVSEQQDFMWSASGNQVDEKFNSQHEKHPTAS